MSEAEVFARYKGFDGVLWPGDGPSIDFPLERGLAALSDIDRVRRYYARHRIRARCDLLAVEREAVCESNDKMPLLGYDFGFLESEDNVYSFLFHEVIHSRFAELGDLTRLLNEHLLFESHKPVKEIESIVERLSRSGARFETSDSPEACVPIAVFSVPTEP